MIGLGSGTRRGPPVRGPYDY